MGVQYHGEISRVLWGVILSTVGDTRYCGDIMMDVGDI